VRVVGHRYDLYTKAAPHAGYHIMCQLGGRMRDGYFSFTSNVDGHFARVFPDDRILECHGYIGGNGHWSLNRPAELKLCLACVHSHAQVHSLPAVLR
jgi:NAD-dependent SIR2 family protein deacetylase